VKIPQPEPFSGEVRGIVTESLTLVVTPTSLLCKVYPEFVRYMIDLYEFYQNILSKIILTSINMILNTPDTIISFRILCNQT